MFDSKITSIIALPEFLMSASSLTKEAKSKLVKTLNLLCADRGHPGLQTKPVKGSKGKIYECRVDRSIRLIYDVTESMIRCWYVGEHDVAIRHGMKLDTKKIDDLAPSKAISIFVNGREKEQEMIEISYVLDL